MKSIVESISQFFLSCLLVGSILTGCASRSYRASADYEMSPPEAEPAVDASQGGEGRQLSNQFLESVPTGRASASASSAGMPSTHAGANGQTTTVTLALAPGSSTPSRADRQEMKRAAKAGSRAPSPPPPASSPSNVPAKSPVSEPAVGTGVGEAERPARREKRLVHYNGYAKLRATSVRDTLEQAGAAAKTAGGYVEKLAGSSITLRVPVDRFRAVFAALLKLGDVLSRSVTAEDVTDSFRAVDLRLHTAIATRERLQALLALARTEQEKLELLRQIQRVTSEIDELTAMFETLKSLASYSRISLEVVPRQALTTQPSRAEIAEMRWIQRLSPFRRDVAYEGRTLRLEPPVGLVTLDNKRHWSAESPDGARIWASRRRNAPRGDAAFWIEALKLRMAPEFASAEVTEVGGFQVLRLVDRSFEDPYRYLIAVKVVGKRLQVVEVYFPSGVQEKRYGEAVMNSIRKGAL